MCHVFNQKVKGQLHCDTVLRQYLLLLCRIRRTFSSSSVQQQQQQCPISALYQTVVIQLRCYDIDF